MLKDNIKYRLYGRSRGRSNKNIDIAKYRQEIKKFEINKFTEGKNYILDIGTGYGETTIYLSQKFKEHKIIACEKYINGNINLMKNIEREQIKNIYIHDSNVHKILDKHEKRKYFDIIFIFFPDPWPKKKHNKRRLINVSFLKKIYHYLNDEGIVYIATDSSSYSKDIIDNIFEVRNIFKCSNLKYLYLSIKDYFDIDTKFYKKAILYGRKPTLFILKKI